MKEIVIVFCIVLVISFITGVIITILDKRGVYSVENKVKEKAQNPIVLNEGKTEILDDLVDDIKEIMSEDSDDEII